jgi:hypothetical protein
MIFDFTLIALLACLVGGMLWMGRKNWCAPKVVKQNAKTVWIKKDGRFLKRHKIKHKWWLSRWLGKPVK